MEEGQSIAVFSNKWPGEVGTIVTAKPTISMHPGYSKTHLKDLSLAAGLEIKESKRMSHLPLSGGLEQGRSER